MQYICKKTRENALRKILPPPPDDTDFLIAGNQVHIIWNYN